VSGVYLLSGALFSEASSINLSRTIVYGLGVLRTSLAFRLQRLGLRDSVMFTDTGDACIPSIIKRAG
jgi:hypothetical protein